MDVSPAPSKNNVRIPLQAKDGRKPGIMLAKSAISNFRARMLELRDISEGERRLHESHSMPADECIASTALFELGRRKGELAAKAAALEASLQEARGARAKVEQAISKNVNKIDSQANAIVEASELASKSKDAIAAAMEEMQALSKNVAFCVAQAKFVQETVGRIVAERVLSGRAPPRVNVGACYDIMAEIAEICEQYAGPLSDSYSRLEAKADLLSKGILSGMHVLSQGQNTDILDFLKIMANSADSTFEDKASKSDIEKADARITKVSRRLTTIASSLSKELESLARQNKSRPAKPPELNEDFCPMFIETARATSAQLLDFRKTMHDMFDAQGKYTLALSNLNPIVNERLGLEAQLSNLPDVLGDERALSQLKGELADLGMAESDLRAELSRLKDRRLEKEAKRSRHAQNRLSREEWERVKSGGEPAKPRFTYSKEPQAEPVMMDATEARKQKFVEAALSLFESSLNKNAMLREQFETTLPELAELYLKGKGSITSKSLFGRFPKRTKHEKVFRNDANEYDIVRLGFSSINEYRLLIDVKNSRQPLIYFVGHKEECEAFMKAVPRKISGCREKALSNGAGSLFAILSPE